MGCVVLTFELQDSLPRITASTLPKCPSTYAPSGLLAFALTTLASLRVEKVKGLTCTKPGGKVQGLPGVTACRVRPPPFAPTRVLTTALLLAKTMPSHPFTSLMRTPCAIRWFDTLRMLMVTLTSWLRRSRVTEVTWLPLQHPCRNT